MRSDQETVISELREGLGVLRHQLRELEKRSATQNKAARNSAHTTICVLRDGCARFAGAIQSLDFIKDEDLWDQELLRVTVMLRDLEEAAITALAEMG